MKVERWTGRVLEGPFEDVYVYPAPVRLWHWVTVLCIFVLAITGYFIGAPPPAIGGEPVDSFYFGWIRTVHFSAAMILIAFFLVRIYWAIVGPAHSRRIFMPPLWSGACRLPRCTPRYCSPPRRRSASCGTWATPASPRSTS